MSVFLTSVLCALIARSAGQRLTSGRNNRIIQKRIERGWAFLQPAWPFRRRLQKQLNTIQLPWPLGGRESGYALQELVLRTECNNHFRYLRLILFYFVVADSVKANQPGNKMFLHGRTMAPVL
jgi:hypothetical protein